MRRLGNILAAVLILVMLGSTLAFSQTSDARREACTIAYKDDVSRMDRKYRQLYSETTNELARIGGTPKFLKAIQEIMRQGDKLQKGAAVKKLERCLTTGTYQ